MAEATGQRHTKTLAELALRTRRAERRSIATLGVIALVATMSFLWLRGRNPRDGTLEFEAAKAALQMLSVAVIGGVISGTAFLFQRNWTELAEWQKVEDERQYREREDAEEKIRQKELHAEEQWERRREEQRDKRARQDHALRELLRSTLIAYNGVKRVRRLVSAVAVDTIGLGPYDNFLETLMDLQLQFEQFARLAPFIDDDRLVPPRRRGAPADAQGRSYISLTQAYEDIESYLNEVVDEYKEARRYVAAATAAGEAFPMSRLPELEGFKHKKNFRPGVSYHMDDIREVLQVALLQPINFSGLQVGDLVAGGADASPAGISPHGR